MIAKTSPKDNDNIYMMIKIYLNNFYFFYAKC